MHAELSAVDLDEEGLLATARERTGLEDFGDEGFREPLRRLVRALESEANLNSLGRVTQHERLVSSLSTRLATQDAWKRHPEIEAEAIERPLVIVGLARTGTTRLHRLLSADPDAYSVRWWECRSPAPHPGSDWRRDDPRIADAHAEVEMILETTPELEAIHPWDPEGPDEEIMLIEHAFLSHVPESGANLPSYRSWLDGQDLAPGYAFLKRMLKYLQWQKKERGEQARRWVLKSPFHLGYIDTLLAEFPDARIVQTHRDPLETIPSVASMYRALWSLSTDRVDAKLVGRQCLERYAWALDRCLESRAHGAEERFLDVDYADVQADPMRELARIYAFIGEPLTETARRAMERWGDENRRDKRAAHHYTLDEFGLAPAEIEAAFARYRERFIVQ